MLKLSILGIRDRRFPAFRNLVFWSGYILGFLEAKERQASKLAHRQALARVRLR